jgi:hypothetical protein
LSGAPAGGTAIGSVDFTALRSTQGTAWPTIQGSLTLWQSACRRRAHMRLEDGPERHQTIFGSLQGCPSKATDRDLVRKFLEGLAAIEEKVLTVVLQVLQSLTLIEGSGLTTYSARVPTRLFHRRRVWLSIVVSGHDVQRFAKARCGPCLVRYAQAHAPRWSLRISRACSCLAATTRHGSKRQKSRQSRSA